MARERSPERDRAMQMWLEGSGKMKLKDIAAALSIPDSKVRKWKTMDGWEEELKGSVSPESKGSAPLRGAPKGNRNAVANRGGAPQAIRMPRETAVVPVGRLATRRQSPQASMKPFGWMR